MSVWKQWGAPLRTQRSRSGVENPEGRSVGGEAGNVGTRWGPVKGVRPEEAGGEKPSAKHRYECCLGRNRLRGGDCVLPLSSPFLLPPPEEALCFCGLATHSSFRSWVSAPARQDLGAARAPGIRMGTGVTQSGNAEVSRAFTQSTTRGEAVLTGSSLWDGGGATRLS